MDLDAPVGGLKGVGPAVEAKLEKLSIATVGDLLNHFPRRYEDFSRILPIRSVKPGPVTVRGKIMQAASRRSFRRHLSVTEAIITDGTGTLKAIWFNQPYLVRQLKQGEEVYMSGRLEFRNNDLALQSPAVEPVDDAGHNTARILPIYPETEGLSSRQLRGLIQPILDKLGKPEDPLPESVRKEAKLMPLAEAWREIHFPSSEQNLKDARRRFGFEELFYPVLASLTIKHEIKTEPAPKIVFKLESVKELVAALGFDLTTAQRKASWQILQDMQRDKPMNRLLEGDVGSGKTVVALIAAVVAMASGYQVALMVPTDILARQHFSRIEPLLVGLGYRTELLLGATRSADKQRIRGLIQDGSVDLIIGTHALLSEEVSFKSLGLIIIDEQHRFGVAQRQALKQKAGHLPHLLSMTATPIPRSLALTIYGDLDITVIDSLPPGRKPVKTQVVKPEERDPVYGLIDQKIGEGRQVFVVCPLIEESDKLGAKSVTAESERLKETVFAHRKIGLLHGRMTPAEKEAVMTDFAVGKIDILVATSVIEVGIDIPNASIMLIEDADRFGLAALHQLRGRIGRGSHESYCFLLYDKMNDLASSRLKAMERTSDGFRLAQIDLELRGPGQIYGARQHGILDLSMADITDTRLIAAVRNAASAFLQTEPELVKYPQVLARVNKLKSVTSLD